MQTTEAKPTPTPRRPRRWRPVLLRRDESGATAIEFGLVAMPFFMLLFAILELALVFWTTQVLETAVADASRQLYTGQFNQTFAAAQTQATSSGQPQPTQADYFKSLVCDKVKALISCGKLQIDVNTFTTDAFPGGVAGPIRPKAGGGEEYDPSFGQFRAPTPNQIMLVRAFTEYPIFTSFLSATRLTLSPDKKSRIIFATAAFRTEPFQP